MLKGKELFELLCESHPLFDGTGENPLPSICFETFPHAIACALEGKTLFAKNKRIDRRKLLQQARVEIKALSNIDLIDAALCALTAHYFTLGRVKHYGESETGVIVVPSQTLSSP